MYIKREDAIEALRLEYPMMPLFKAMREEWALRTEGFRRAEEVIMRLPSAGRKGEWIESDTDGFICSACGNGYRNQPTCMGKPMFEYCPFCGAKMIAKDTNVPNKEGAEDE